MSVTDFIRYLAAKRTVDDRALNRGVWETLAAALPPTGALDVLELGAGIGTMVERCLDWRLLAAGRYTLVDAAPELMATAKERMGGWAGHHGWGVNAGQSGGMRLQRAEQWLELAFEACDALTFAEHWRGRRAWDLLIAHAFLDLVDIPRVLPVLLDLLRPSGLFYFTITFDGVTTFQAELDADFDALVEVRYHETMDRRLVGGKPSGDHRSGRRLFGHLQTAGAIVLAAGGSDWVVLPQQGRYPADEAYFLHFIIDTVEKALADDAILDPARLAAWATARRQQIERGELVYITHQLDVAGRVG